MAAADLSTVHVLSDKAAKLNEKCRYARAAETFAEASRAAQALQLGDDCLVVIDLRLKQAYALLKHSIAPSLTAEESKAMQGEALLKIPLAVIPALERRRVAGTLLPGTCRAAEEAHFIRAVSRTRAEDEDEDAPGVRPGLSAATPAEVLAAGKEIGCELFFSAAHLALLALPMLGRALRAPVPQQIRLAMQQQCSLFGTCVSNALGITLQGLPEGVFRIKPEVLKTCVSHEEEGWLSEDGPYGRRVWVTWRLLKGSGLLQDPSVSGLMDYDARRSERITQAHEEACAAPNPLHACALAACTAREAEASQFKKCAACQLPRYCCKAHQEADWPAHKAACKAARNAAALEAAAGPSGTA
jgi:hypothetical protein